MGQDSRSYLEGPRLDLLTLTIPEVVQAKFGKEYLASSLQDPAGLRCCHPSPLLEQVACHVKGKEGTEDPIFERKVTDIGCQALSSQMARKA